MSDFVYDGTSIPEGKVDNRPLNVPPNQGITADEWNTSAQAIKDLRTALLAGKFHGFAEGNKISIMAAIPTTGSWATGDFIVNKASSTSLQGWICTTAGTFPGSPPVFTAFNATLSVAAVSNSPNSAGATASGGVLTLQPADGTNPGVVTSAAQTFGGDKHFTGAVDAANLNGTNTGDVSLAAVGSSPSANGASVAGQVLTLQPADGTHPGVVTSGTQTIGGNKTFSGTVGASNLSNTNTGDVTLAAVGSSPSANGASLSGQALTLQPADGTHPGALTSVAQTIGGDKTFAGTCDFGSGALHVTNTGFVVSNTIGFFQQLAAEDFFDGSGTAGNQTINHARGRCKIAAGGTAVTITTNKVSLNSQVICVIETNDATAILKNVQVTATTFTINIAACTGDTVISFHCIKD